MSTEAHILHADVDAFFASVEQRDDPRLRRRPVIVGSGVVLAASYEARAFGVRSAMGGARARRLCPHAIVVAPRFAAYVEASRAVFEVFEQTAPVVEGLSLEEAFLDVRGLERISGSPPAIAAQLRRDVREHAGLTISVGVATTRILAKLASRAAKPDGLLVVAPGQELAFLHPLLVHSVWGIGAASARKLHAQGLETVGQVARCTEADLIAILGRSAGLRLHALARNGELGPRRTRGRGRRSFGSQSALGRSRPTPTALDVVVLALVDRVTRRMRAAGRTGRTVVLRLRFNDFSRATRSHTLPAPTAATWAILAAARTLLTAALPVIERRGVTLIGVAVTNLEGESHQLALPVDGPDRSALDAVLDQVRARFGPGAITRAALLGRRERGGLY